jgi:thiol:disulfide interchange protein/DsbC/DsbD-like thiol-disulfide interchange protein
MKRLPCLLWFFVASAALAAPVQRPHIEVELVAEKTSIRPGETTTLALRLKSQKHWHTYWKNPGDSGLPTRITWSLPPGFEAGPIQWPVPSRINVGPLTNFGYEGEIFLLTDIRVPADLAPGASIPINARADWLVCEEICIPGDASFRLDLPVGTEPTTRDARWSKHFDRARKNTPGNLTGWETHAFHQGKDLVIRLASTTQSRVIRELTFFPDSDGWIENAAPQKLFHSPRGFELRIAAAPDIGKRSGPLSGLLVAGSGLEENSGAATVSMRYSATAPANDPDSGAMIPGADGEITPVAPQVSLGLLAAIAAAFLGGMILNLMPCVFPVVSIKVLGFVEKAHRDPAKLRAHGLAFTAGVLISFWAVAGVLLGLRAQGESLGWGYQLQSPLVVAGLALLFFVMALNLSGIFEFGARIQSWLGNVRLHNSYGDSALAGLLATIVATPCTAPFMGAALGFALVQPALEAMTVFSALALGMAAPYLVLSFSPALIARLPRPGAWMVSLKQWLAFPLYLTVAWLAWVLGRQLGVDAMARLVAGLILIAAALWLLGGQSGNTRRGRRQIGALAVAGMLGVSGLLFAWPASLQNTNDETQATSAWKPWSELSVTQARAAGKAVFVDFTAAWCVTCQVNKRLVLESNEVEKRLHRDDVALFRADWTQRDADITTALGNLGRSGVPVYAVYAAKSNGAPVLLPELLTREHVLEAIDKAAGTSIE